VTYLLDTNVLSETRKREPAPSVAGWIAATPPARLHVSALTLGEIQQGIERIRAKGDRQQAAALEGWLRELEAGFDDRVLPVTLPVASAWGRQQRAHRRDRPGTRDDRGHPEREGFRAFRSAGAQPL
jgi:predicted nucleic acid-binding protein